MEVMSNTEKCGQDNNDQKNGNQSKTTVTNDNTDTNSATNKDESKYRNANFSLMLTTRAPSF